jgi:parvulin-like peptidyl-prolyl isomerase
LAQIFIALPKTADKTTTDKAQGKLEAVKKSLHQNGADFAAIAKANSEESESAPRGGEIGWLGENQVQPEVRPQVLSLSKNATSEPIRLEDGWHILKVLDIKEAYTPTLDEIRSQLVQQTRRDFNDSITTTRLCAP